LRLPFAHVGLYLSIQGESPSNEERRAIENTAQFLVSLTILARRMRTHLETYRHDSWVEVPFYELFLDTQSLFLFIQQYLEDLALILRMSLPHSERHQMPAAFRKLSRRLRERILESDEPLKIFLDQEAPWFEEISDVRDDICHRTAYDKARNATFPRLSDVLRAGGGIAPFLSASDLRCYIGGLFRRILALSCVAETFVYKHIVKQYAAQTEVPPALVVAEGENDLAVTTKEPLFPPGTMIMTLSRVSLDNLEFFLKAE